MSLIYESSNPGKVKLSEKKWLEMVVICRPKSNVARKKSLIAEYMWFGDFQPAIVVSLEPLKIAAYSDEMDAVVILKFPNALIKIYNLDEKDRLITTNVYYTEGSISNDIYIGENYQNRYVDFFPTIIDFLSDDIQIIDEHKKNISKETWNYVYELGKKHVENFPFAREGFALQNITRSKLNIDTNKLLILFSVICSIIFIVTTIINDGFLALILTIGAGIILVGITFIYYLIKR